MRLFFLTLRALLIKWLIGDGSVTDCATATDHECKHADFTVCVSYHIPLIFQSRHLQFLISKCRNGLHETSGCCFDANAKVFHEYTHNDLTAIVLSLKCFVLHGSNSTTIIFISMTCISKLIIIIRYVAIPPYIAT